MGETVKVQVEIDTQEGMGLADTHKQVEEFIDDLDWALCGDVVVRDVFPFEVTVWMMVRAEMEADQYGRWLKSELVNTSWCLVQGGDSAEWTER
ncbi:MAG: hypothetical protein ABEH80_09550 [Halobaculum sp.]